MYGQENPQSTRGTTEARNKPHALMVILKSEQSNEELLAKAEILMDMQLKKIFITQDQIPKERALWKELVAEKDRRVANGEYFVIVRGRVVKRREKN